MILVHIFISISVANIKFDPDKTHFSVYYNQEHSQYRINGVFMIPKESLTIEVKKTAGESFSLEMGECLFLQTGGAQWKWQAPDTTAIPSLS